MASSVTTPPSDSILDPVNNTPFGYAHALCSSSLPSLTTISHSFSVLDFPELSCLLFMIGLFYIYHSCVVAFSLTVS